VTIMVDTQRALTGGVDTHADVHVAAVIDPQGGLLGVKSFTTDLTGYKLLSAWMCAFGEIALVGVEGTGSYGAGLARHLAREGFLVVEVDRPNRQERARQGKTDSLDAVEAARAALSGRAFGVAKTRDGNVVAIRTLGVGPVIRVSRSTPNGALGGNRNGQAVSAEGCCWSWLGIPEHRVGEVIQRRSLIQIADPIFQSDLVESIERASDPRATGGRRVRSFYVSSANTNP